MKKIVSLLLALTLVFALAACGTNNGKTPEPSPAPVEPQNPVETADPVDINLYVLSGPTGIGAVNLRAKAEAGETLSNNYHVTMTGANDEVVAAVSKGEADIACVATNLAATLYNKTEGGVKVLAVNTLGVLSILTNGTEVSAVSDLKGKTIYSPGQGANPEYILRYVLQGNGLDPDQDVTIRFVGEGGELLTVWQSNPQALIMAPQPVATSLLMQNEGAKKAFDMTEEWEKISGGDSTLMMGCVIIRTAFLEEHPEAVAGFLKDYAASIEAAKNNVEDTAVLCEQYGIIPKAALAKQAIPQCGLTYVVGSDMKTLLSGYLTVMFKANPKSVGGKLPADDFYYVA
ncbi:MAG: ABC transporter substrate-binding protein [Oscillospiraceae bacterium]|nr:ABC transporter substrate-binding protein [Oscillospiraceae bacterium]